MGIKPNSLVITVSGAGTPSRVSTNTNLYVTSAYFEPITSMTGYAYIGISTVSSTAYMAARQAAQGFSLASDTQGKASSAAGGGEINLSSIYIDAQQAGARVMVTYLTRVGSD